VLGVLILGAAACILFAAVVLEQHPNSTCAENPDANSDAEASFQPCKDEHSKREARVSTGIKTYVTRPTIIAPPQTSTHPDRCALLYLAMGDRRNRDDRLLHACFG
jgi:hypothetical protein